MVEPAESAKILVRAANGDLWLVQKGANPVRVHSELDPQPKDQTLVGILNNTDNAVADHFDSANPGVKVGITVVDLDAQP
jgi:hypothetical protein